MLKKTSLLLPLIILIFISCAVTKITTVVDHEFQNMRYSKLLIISTFADLSYKQKVETSFKKYCMSKDIDAEISYELLPPVREYSWKEVTEILEENYIDGILIVGLQDYWTSSYYMPESYQTTGSAQLVGNSIIYSQKTKKYGGYYYNKPSVAFESRFFDSATGKAIWRASSVTKGNAFARFSTLANSLSRSTINKLIKDRIISPERKAKEHLK